MSALLLVEAIDTAGVLLDAVLAWIVVAGFVATAGLYTAVLTGAWAWRAVRRRSTGPLAASQSPKVTRPTLTPPKPTVPSWAHDEQEAA